LQILEKNFENLQGPFMAVPPWIILCRYSTFMRHTVAVWLRLACERHIFR